jgi:hypothetical protein
MGSRFQWRDLFLVGLLLKVHKANPIQVDAQ